MLLLRIILVISFLAVIMQPSDGFARNEVRIFKYYNADQYSADFNDFYHSIRNKLRLLAIREDLSDPAKHLIGGISPVKVVSEKNGVESWAINELNNNQLHQYWRQYDKIVQIFHGRIEESTNSNYRKAKSYAFFGDLNHSLSADSVLIELEISGEQHDTNQDSHSAIILYAVVLDILDLINGNDVIVCDDSHIAKSLITVAFNSANNVADKSAVMGEVRDAIRLLGDRLAEECSA